MNTIAKLELMHTKISGCINIEMNTNKEWSPGHCSHTWPGHYTPWPGELHLYPHTVISLSEEI